MKNSSRGAIFLLSLLLAIVGGPLTPQRAAAQEVGLTANVGWVNEYLYRGIPQKTSSASAGLDVTAGGAYAGTWAADVGDGTEVDLYGGYGIDVGGLALSAGGTGYFYTGDFDDTYLEINFGASYGFLAVEVARGRYRTQPEALDYTFAKVTAEHAGAYVSVGSFFDDFSGEYGEIGYGFTAGDLDLSIAAVLSDEELALLPSREQDVTLVLGVGKTFTLR